MSARGVFVAGTDTGIGKTRIAALLVRAQRACGRSAVGMKPVASGCRETPDGCQQVLMVLIQLRKGFMDLSVLRNIRRCGVVCQGGHFHCFQLVEAAHANGDGGRFDVGGRRHRDILDE